MLTMMLPVASRLHQHHCASTALSSPIFIGRPEVELVLAVRKPGRQRQTVPVGFAIASSAEPKWKLKLQAADEIAERSRRATALAQEQYKKRQEDIRKQQISANSNIANLSDLEYIPYLTDDGRIVDCTRADAKASVYAIFDERKALQYVGVTRAVYPSMRLHFARVPSKCFYAKVEHLTKPSRALLESIRDKWIADSQSRPPGNDNGEQQNLWENPLDCTNLMTDEERENLQNAPPGPAAGKILKNVARRIERGLQETFDGRKCTDRLRFDPKLKERGLLDLKNTDQKLTKREPDTAVPETNIKPAAATV